MAGGIWLFFPVCSTELNALAWRFEFDAGRRLRMVRA